MKKKKGEEMGGNDKWERVEEEEEKEGRRGDRIREMDG